MFDDLDEAFRDMEELLQKQFEELSQTVPRELVRERTLPDGSKVKEWGPFVYGYSMTMDPDGKPRIREFGNIKPGTRKGRPRIDFKEQREPLIDVLETEDAVRIVAEVPGVEKQDINLRGSETAIKISVDTTHRKYYKEVDLPAQIDPKRAKSTYKNGILEVTLPKKAKEKPTGERISIE